MKFSEVDFKKIPLPREIDGEIEFRLCTLNAGGDYYEGSKEKNKIIKLTIKYLQKVKKYYKSATVRFDNTELKLK